MPWRKMLLFSVELACTMTEPSVRSTSAPGRYSLIATDWLLSSRARYTMLKPPPPILRTMVYSFSRYPLGSAWLG